MKKLLISAALLLVGSAALAADVNVSIQIGEPRYYGRIDVVDLPPPVLVDRRPIIVERVRTAAPPPPVYLRVPPGYAKNWSKYCHEYEACGRPVYFVQDRWYRDVYAPAYQKRGKHGHDRDDDHRGKGKYKEKHKDKGEKKQKHKNKHDD